MLDLSLPIMMSAKIGQYQPWDLGCYSFLTAGAVMAPLKEAVVKIVQKKHFLDEFGFK